MKCLVLAGGKGNSLWPISREEYPKQFMEIKQGHSLFQETIARNIPFCDEFLITTSMKYHFIVEGQMQAFQSLRYRCFLEEEGRGTCLAIALVCMSLSPSELLYVVSADQIIEGSAYKETILRGTQLAKEGQLVVFGMHATSPRTDYGYIRHEDEKVLEFREKPDPETAAGYIKTGGYLWNSGNCIFRAGDFLYELENLQPDLFEAYQEIRKHVSVQGHAVTIPAFSGQRFGDREGSIPRISIEHAVLEHSRHVSVVEAAFHWWDMGSLDVLRSYMKRMEGRNSILEDSPGSAVINHSNHRLVVVNGVPDITVINTDDACYISSESSSQENDMPGGRETDEEPAAKNRQPATNIKDIIRQHPEYSSWFEKSNLVYRPWGIYEVLNFSEHYKVKKVSVFPGRSLTSHRHSMRSEQWSVVEGTATVILNGQKRVLGVYDSIQIPVGAMHSLANDTEKPLTVIEVSFGQQVREEDQEDVQVQMPSIETDELILCEPAFKDSIWGGTLLRERYHKKCDYEIIAESWELSAHADGMCRVGSGKHQGMFFGEYLQLLPEEALGWKCQAFEKFPLLIKLIDARNSLSVQVHPSDDFALPVENEYGKNEMWYILDCEPGSYLYLGLNRDVTSEELRKRAEDQTITEVLNKIEVHPGESYFIEAGTVHAIGAGILICEIQQNSNCTYRLYDYGRKDRYGHTRELHLDKAMQVVNCKSIQGQQIRYPEIEADGYRQRMLCECKYFTTILYNVDPGMQAQITVDETSFCAITILDGEGVIRGERQEMYFHPADCFFITAGPKTIRIEGACQFILTKL